VRNRKRRSVDTEKMRNSLVPAHPSHSMSIDRSVAGVRVERIRKVQLRRRRRRRARRKERKEGKRDSSSPAQFGCVSRDCKAAKPSSNVIYAILLRAPLLAPAESQRGAALVVVIRQTSITERAKASLLPRLPRRISLLTRDFSRGHLCLLSFPLSCEM